MNCFIHIAYVIAISAAVFPICLSFPTDGDLVIELESGSYISSGRILVGYTYNPARYPVCADDFTLNVARVVCRVLGYTGLPAIPKRDFFGTKPHDKWLTGLRCTGAEAKLEDCMTGFFDHNCRSQEDAGVYCSNSPDGVTTPTTNWIPPNPMLCGVSSLDEVSKDPTFLELDQLPDISPNLVVTESNVTNEVKAEPRITQFQAIESTRFFPWIAQVRYSTGTSSMFMCGAAIISEFFVITSAPCALPSLIKEGSIRVGNFEAQVSNTHERSYKIQDMATTANNGAKDRIHLRDIALIKIQPDENGKGIQFSAYVLPACLPTAYTVYRKNMICDIGGYGRNEFLKESRYLRAGTIPLLAKNVCLKSEGSRKYFQEGLFCAGGIPWSSTGCTGDRGSPLVCKINGRSVLLGIDSVPGCTNPAKISYYVDIQYHLPWIAREIKRMS